MKKGDQVEVSYHGKKYASVVKKVYELSQLANVDLPVGEEGRTVQCTVHFDTLKVK